MLVCAGMRTRQKGRRIMAYIWHIFPRVSIAHIRSWWRSLDKVLLFLIVFLFCIGIITSFSVPGSNHMRLNPIDGAIINKRFLFFAGIGVAMFIFASALSLKWINRLCVLAALMLIVVLVLLPFMGFENKGATRWLVVGGVSMQPSEFVKPVFAVVSAWFFAARFVTVNIPASAMSLGLFMVFAVLFIIQPDLGQTVLLTGIWTAQLWVAGLSIAVLPAIVILIGAMIGLAYIFFPHVSNRIQGFLNQGDAETYQVDMSLQAFQSGGVFGQGLGSGTIKYYVPDSHTDFIFAVYGEEGGMFLTVLILGVFMAIITRMLWLIRHKNDPFSMIAMVGICVQFAMQAAINIASTTGLMPPKGMTLPLISMGGSSYVAVAGSLGLFMALSRRRKYDHV